MPDTDSAGWEPEAAEANGADPLTEGTAEPQEAFDVSFPATAGVLGGGAAYRPAFLQPEQAKTQTQVEGWAAPSKAQRNALGTMRTAQQKALPLVSRITLRWDEEDRTRELLATAQAERNERGMFDESSTAEIPAPVKWVAAAFFVWIFWLLDQAMLVFLRLPLRLTSLLAMILALALECSAMAYGRASAARKRYPVPELQLPGTAKIILRIAPPIAMGMQATLAILRSVLTGQIITSIVLGLAGAALWWVSAYINDHSYAPGVATEKRAKRSLGRQVRLTGQAEKDHARQRRHWEGGWDVLRQEAATRLGMVQSLTSAVDAAVRRTGRESAPWPLTPPLAQQMAWSESRLADNLMFPMPPPRDAPAATARLYPDLPLALPPGGPS